MPEDKPLKSAYELAMERLRSKDRDDGVGEDQPLGEDQKQEIARLRQEAKAKVAELEILHRKNVHAAGGDPEAVAKIEEHYRTDRARVESKLESAVEKVKRSRE